MAVCYWVVHVIATEIKAEPLKEELGLTEHRRTAVKFCDQNP